MIARFVRYAHALVAVLLVAPAGCSDADADAPRHASLSVPSITTVLIDRSGSRTPSEMAGDRQLLKEIIAELGFGERIVVLQVHHAGRSDGARRWMSEMPMPENRALPTPVDRQSLDRTRSAAALAATALFDSIRPNRTDLIATLFDAADVIRGGEAGGGSAPSHSRIIMLSDMLQSTRELNMENGDFGAAETFLQERKRQGVMPDLARTCVVVVGGDRSTANGARAFRFWQDYFAAAGAEFRPSNYRYTAMGGQGLRC